MRRRCEGLGFSSSPQNDEILGSRSNRELFSPLLVCLFENRFWYEYHVCLSLDIGDGVVYGHVSSS